MKSCQSQFDDPILTLWVMI